MVAQHYRWDFIGLSTDVKPTPATSEKVVDGSTFYCSDNSKLYVYCKNQWYEKTATGGGGGGGSYTAGTGITIADDTISVDTTTIQPKLTAGSNITISEDTISANDTTYSNFVGTDGSSAGTAGLVPAPATTDAGKFLKANGTWDTAGGGSAITILDENNYNWPVDNPTSIVFGKFEPGLYRVKDDTIAVIDGESNNKYKSAFLYIVTEANSQGWKYVYVLRPNADIASNTFKIKIARYVAATGQFNSVIGNILSTDWVIDDLTHNGFTIEPLSANQGYVLKGLIDALDARITALGG